MSDAASQAAPAPLSLVARMVGIVTSPRDTHAAIVATPRWIDVLAVTTLLAAALTYAFLSTSVGRQAMLDQQIATMESFGVQVGDAQVADMERGAARSLYFAIPSILVGAPLFTVVIAGIFFGVFNAALGGTASFRQVLAVVAHSGVIGTVGMLFTTPLNYLRESMSDPANLGVFFPMLDEASPLAAFFGAIKFFTVWWFVVLGIGMAVLYRRRSRPIVLSLVGLYLLWAVGVAVFRAVVGGA
jgi:hypothetical protein